jgi:hypothetical protein
MLRRLPLLLLFCTPSLHTAPPQAAFLDQHCVECHDADVKKGGLDLASLKWTPENGKNFDTWIKIHDRVSKGEMPPAKKPRPPVAEKEAFVAGLQKPLQGIAAAAQAKTGRTILRRLNRSEYENTLHDLLGIETPLKDLLPEDGSAHGFDTVADGLRLSTLHLEKYLEAADEALDAAIVLTKKPEIKKGRHSYKDEKNIQKNLALPDDPPSDPKKKYNRERQVFRDLPDAMVMFTSADYLLGLSQARIEREGTYRVRASAYAYQSNGKDVNLRFYSNNFREKRLLGSYDMPPDKPRLVEFTARILRGEHLLLTPTGVGIAADGQKLSDSDTTKEFKGTGLAVQWVEFEGPIEAEQWPPRSISHLFGDTPVLPLDPKKIKNQWDKNAIGYEITPADPAANVKPLLDRFAERAFRRPLEPGETDRFVTLVQSALQSGDDFVNAMRIGFRAILTAPQFLLFDEAPGRLGDYALASRLSYFLWSTLPDEGLLRLAAEKKLSQSETLRSEVSRMIQDLRATAFVTNFTGQWLDLRGIDATTPDSRLYPEFDEMLKRAMVAESEGFFREMLLKNLPVTNIIQSDFVMLNSRLAEHYGIPDVRGEEFRPVKLAPGSPRGGVLTQASVLKVTANGTVTSPVLRGAWVMKRILADPPAPPPPNVGSVEPDTRGATTIRELLDKHRNAESCMGCHNKMDPPGFALEGFDVIGGVRDRYRSKENGDRPPGTFENRGIWQYKLALPVDTTGQLPDGRKFTGIRDFKQLLASDPNRICQALATKLLIYSTGAGISFADRAEVSRIAEKTMKQGGGLRDLVTEIVLSPTFQSK